MQGESFKIKPSEIDYLKKYRSLDSIGKETLGDTLLIEMTDEVNKGEIGIFSVDNNCYVKKRGDNELISLNPDSRNVPMNETTRCMGKVIDMLNENL